jgi:ABC-type transport system involved in cytochrome c biogenesis permease subunit
MSTTTPHDYIGEAKPKTVTKTQPNPAFKALQILASLRVTVVLFSLSMALVFFGTLAMMHESIEETMKRYFRSWYVMVELRAISDFGKVFLPAFFSEKSEIPGKIPFPGGYTIGWAMFINLLAAHAIRFKLTWKRSGIFLLHAGVIVLLAGEFMTGQLAVETRMLIKEGESSRFVFHLNNFELAIVDSTNPEHDDVIVVPGEMITDAKKDEWVSHPDVPFEVQLVEHHVNARLRNLRSDETAIADKGLGRGASIEPKPKVKGTDSSGEVNYPAVYLKLRDKNGEAIGTYLFSTMLDHRPQDVKTGDKTYKVTYRFKRTYKPYTVLVDKAEHDVYPGTTIPKDYASTVRVMHPELGEHGPIRIWMNHPMYYEGETFYQSSMHTDEDTGVKTTGLQVVINPAWTFPYFACTLVALGMGVHFLIRLWFFLMARGKRQVGDAVATSGVVPGKKVLVPTTAPQSAIARFFPLAVVVVAALMLVARGMTPSPKTDRFDLYGFGKIPVQHGGRLKPIDSLARNSLVVISGKQEFVDTSLKEKPTYSATEWLIIVWADPVRAQKFRIFRVDHPEVLALLNIPQRPGLYRYSMDELDPKMPELERQAAASAKKPKEKRTHFDERVLDLAKHIQIYRDLQIRKDPGIIASDDPNAKWQSHADAIQKLAPEFLKTAELQVRKELGEELHKNRELMVDLVFKHLGDVDIEELARRTKRKPDDILRNILEQEVEYRSLRLARTQVLATIRESEPQLDCIEKMLDAYKAGSDPKAEAGVKGVQTAAFNGAVQEYHEKHTTKVESGDKFSIKLEAWMNYFDPFYWCAGLYVGVVILAALSWLVWHEPLRRSAFWLAVFTFAIHTGALLARMYIGNRPPVTNLYSSAVFIGWGGLGLCLILERIYRLGVGSFAGAALGFGTMLVARFLAESGDTLEMLQAVLDTNFWLATHVTCVTLGYVATFVAGVIAWIYIIGGMFTKALGGQTGRHIAGMMYGTLCFATLLSFTGTVLGGIWADQSWGRFWGWDPKENGAVLIVIWNALILHARWAGIIKGRGMAILAVIGNMWTAWSWFGTNQLGIGLHAYGFDNRLAVGCAVFWLSQSLIAALGMVPSRFWASFGPEKS